MERESTKHGPALDEQLRHETEALTRSTNPGHTREDLRQEDPVEGDLGLIDGWTRAELMTRHGITGTEAEVRAEMAARLAAAPWPAAKDDVVNTLKAAEADDGLVAWTSLALDPGGRWATFQDVWDSLGGTHEHR